jgi:hypothetical protein
MARKGEKDIGHVHDWIKSLSEANIGGGILTNQLNKSGNIYEINFLNLTINENYKSCSPSFLGNLEEIWI